MIKDDPGHILTDWNLSFVTIIVDTIEMTTHNIPIFFILIGLEKVRTLLELWLPSTNVGGLWGCNLIGAFI